MSDLGVVCRDCSTLVYDSGPAYDSPEKSRGRSQAPSLVGRLRTLHRNLDRRTPTRQTVSEARVNMMRYLSRSTKDEGPNEVRPPPSSYVFACAQTKRALWSELSEDRYTNQAWTTSLSDQRWPRLSGEVTLLGQHCTLGLLHKPPLPHYRGQHDGAKGCQPVIVP